MGYKDISIFQETNDILQDTHWLLVVKSQDQIERRQRMLDSRQGKKIGRLKPRPTATGLLVCGRLADSTFELEWKKEFREPRHICRLEDGSYLLTEMNRLLQLNPAGEVVQSYSHPYFAFLHTVALHSDKKRALVVSSGYDSVFELDLETGQETFRWIAWNHGFNPDEDGWWLAADQALYDLYQEQGKKALLIEPADYGEQGLVTARRSAHPNGAVYDPFDGEESAIVSIGHNGNLYRVNLATAKTELLCDRLNQMPHGLIALDDGWAITNTTRGEWWLMDDAFRLRKCYSVTRLGGKIAGTEDVEWVQQVIPVGKLGALFLDANRGLIAVDLDNKRYSVYQPDLNWCIQDALYLE